MICEYRARQKEEHFVIDLFQEKAAAAILRRGENVSGLLLWRSCLLVKEKRKKKKSLKAVKERGSVEILFELIGELLN